ncbi:hypothetical protein ACJX0J_028221, partial [Zea mays]
TSDSETIFAVYETITVIAAVVDDESKDHAGLLDQTTNIWVVYGVHYISIIMLLSKGISV